ncbi:MAG: dihydroorotate dehydrogenase-like protein [Bacteroidales bacterium]|nr:dihydroorotate dehydrogenase-like protein [Bacteroidales bacterium]
MNKLAVKYMGLNLKNPIIIGSSGLTDSAGKIEKLAENGAGAVVLKSLFEEQINYEAGSMLVNGQYPEAEDYLVNYLKSNNIDSYLRLIEDSKMATDIPIIASINCMQAGEWVSFAKSVVEAGADALELNVFFIPTDVKQSSEHFEEIYYNIVTAVRETVNIPVAVKIGQNFTNLPAFAGRLYNRGAKSVVMFNRFYAPDINIDNLEFAPADVLSTSEEIRNSLRWVGIVSSVVPQIDVCASTGIHDGKAVIKQLLAGARTVQLCSSIYKNGPGHIKTIINDIEGWMKKNTFESIKDFNGRLSYKHIQDPTVFERSQFMKYFSDRK